MANILTKNLVISVLAGISIIGGAFWSRSSSNANTASITNINSGPVGAIKDSTDPSVTTDADGNIIKVADLPNINGLSQLSLADIEKLEAYYGELTPEEISGLDHIMTLGPSTLDYDEITDKNSLYKDGPEKYSRGDIKNIVTTNRASLLAYAVNISKIFNGYPFYKESSPTEITFDIYSNKIDGASGLAELETIKTSYASTTEKLLLTDTPDDLIDIHLRLINTSNRISALINNMENVSEDQLLALNSARHYLEEMYFIVNTLAELSIYLENKNIALGEEDKLTLSIDAIN